MNNNHDPFVSIIILNFNAGDLLLECVSSLVKTNYKNYEIIVVDNASLDNSQKKCKEKFCNIRLIENEQNLGYCEGNNIGIRQASGQYIMILNPDTIVEPNCINELLLAYNKYGDGLYQPKILDNENHDTFISSGNFVNSLGFGYSRGKGKVDFGQYDTDQDIGYASGTCLFTSSKILKKIGNFDPFLFAYHDDLDLGWRARILGIKSYYVFKSIVYHPLEGYSFKLNGFKMYLLERNRIYCILKNYSTGSIIRIGFILLLVDLLVTIYLLKKRFFWVKIKANLNIIRNIKKIQKNKKIIQENRNLSDKEVMDFFSEQIEIPVWMNIHSEKMLYYDLIIKLSKIMKQLLK